MNNGFNIKQARWSFIKTVFNYAEIMKLQFFIFYFLWTFLKVIYRYEVNTQISILTLLWLKMGNNGLN